MAKLWDRLRRRFGGHDEPEYESANVRVETDTRPVAPVVATEVTLEVEDAVGASGGAARDGIASFDGYPASLPAAPWSPELVISRDVATTDQPVVEREPDIVEVAGEPWAGTAGDSLDELATHAQVEAEPDFRPDTVEALGGVLSESTALDNDESDGGGPGFLESANDGEDSALEDPEPISADETDEDVSVAPKPERRRGRRREPSELDGQPARLVLPGRPLKRNEVPTLDTPLLLWSHDADGTVVVRPSLYACVQTQWYGSSLYFLVIPWAERDDPGRSARLVVDATQLRVAPAEMVH